MENKKSITELKNLLEKVNKKYRLENSINSTIEKNLLNHLSQVIEKFNVLKVTDYKRTSVYKKIEVSLKDKFPNMTDEELLKDFGRTTNTEEVFKDFSEITQEVKTLFNQFNPSDKINEILKDLRFKEELYIKTDRYDYYNKTPLKEIKNALETNIKNELTFNVYFSYSSTTNEVKKELEKINNFIKLKFGIEENLNNDKLKYDQDLNTIQETFNNQLKTYSFKIYKNGNLKIKFNDNKHFNTFKEMLIKKELERLSRTFFIEYDYNLVKENGRFTLYKDNSNKLYLSLDLNIYQIEKLENRLIEVKDIKQDLKCLFDIHKTDKFRVDYIKKELREKLTDEQQSQIISDLNAYII